MAIRVDLGPLNIKNLGGGGVTATWEKGNLRHQSSYKAEILYNFFFKYIKNGYAINCMHLKI